jgi:hypothetical protein
MKSGTTWLYDKLKQHPEIHFSRAKEIHFLAHYYGHSKILSSDKRQRRTKAALQRISRNTAITPEKRESAINWYNAYTTEPVDFKWFESVTDSQINNAKYVADFSNLNCHLNAQDWHEIKRDHVDRLRVIYILRDPIMRIWSHYKFHLEFSNNALAEQPDQDFSYFKQIIGKPWFWRNSTYSQSIMELTCGLDSNELKIIYFEDMVESPDSTIEDIENFLQVKKFEYKGDFKTAKNKSNPTKLPPEWETYLCEKTKDEVQKLKEMGWYHPKWRGLSD